MIKYNIMIENLIISISAFFNKKKNKNISRVKEHMPLDLINTWLIKQDDTIHKKWHPIAEANWRKKKSPSRFFHKRGHTIEYQLGSKHIGNLLCNAKFILCYIQQRSPIHLRVSNIQPHQLLSWISEYLLIAVRFWTH